MRKTQTNGKDPAVLLYTQDFIVGTLTMTNEQKGKYITLICFQHQKENKLTLNDLSIAEGDETILAKFPLHEDGYYYNDRLAMEIENRKVKTDSSRKNGILGGRPKKETQEKPMGFNLVNLKETYDKPNDIPDKNPAENEAEAEAEYVNEYVNEAVNEAVVVNENESGNVNVNHKDDLHNYNTNNSNSLKNIIQKTLDILVDYNADKKRYKNAIDDFNDMGGIDKIAKTMGWDDSVKNNWYRQIASVYNNNK